MKFELYILNIITMKKIAVLLSAVFLFTACSSTKELSSARAENRKSKKLAEQAGIKKAIESRRYIIKVNRLYSRGARYDLISTTNFVIINGEIASISLGYMGGSFGIHKITGINLNGHANNYKMESNESRGVYKIQMSVTYGSDKFDVYLTVGKSGSCSISLNNAYIQTVDYTGYLVPIPDSINEPADKKARI
jgi:hypothetical protein